VFREALSGLNKDQLPIMTPHTWCSIHLAGYEMGEFEAAAKVSQDHRTRHKKNRPKAANTHFQTHSTLDQICCCKQQIWLALRV
jgi:hypothetical protein